MDLNGLAASVGMVVGIFALIGLANLVDCSFRTMAEERARQAESIRFKKWGLPPRPSEEPPANKNLWHF